MGAIPDDMGGIFAHLREAALTMQQGGGIGYDFSTLRPHGAPVKGVGADASGPLSFMDVWDAMCRTIMSAGYRRGAMMATLRCDHPDIEAFIEAKREPGRLRMFNLSVLVTDAFMQAVDEDAPWQLSFAGTVAKVLPARELWDKIMRATYAYAEPGVIFIDRINRRNNLWYCETDQRRPILAANSRCRPMAPACLGSLNLARLVERAVHARRRGSTPIGWRRLVPDCVRMMDNVIDISRFPLPQQQEEARAEAPHRPRRHRARRRADHVRAALRLGRRRSRRPRHGSARSSARPISPRPRSPPKKAPSRCSTATNISPARPSPALDPDVREAIARHGIRNALLTSVAPTGTISLFADNVSSGIEPVFSFRYTRNVLMPDGTRREEEVSDYAYRLFRRLKGETAPLPEYFVDAQTLSPDDHLVMQAAVQRHIDSSISKTINVPADIPFERFKDVYAQAYALGCKGCTTYRPNEVTGAVLEARPEAAAGDRRAHRRRGRPNCRCRRRPPVACAKAGRCLRGRRRRLHDAAAVAARGLARPDLQGALAGQRARALHHPERHHPGRPAAAVRDLHQLEEHGALRLDRGVDPDDQRRVPPRRRRVVCRRGDEGGVRPARRRLDGGQYVPSLLAAIGDVIERHMIEIGFLPPRRGTERTLDAQVVNLAAGAPGAP